MANREVDVAVRYVLSVADHGVAKALALTKDFGKASAQAEAVVAKSAKLQQAQWQAVARVAEVADVKIATSAIKASVKVTRATEHTINALRKQGVAYEEIAVKQRAAGTSAGELASAMEAASRREIAAMERVRAVAEKPIRQRISEGASTARGGATRFVGGLAAAGGSLALAGTAAAGSLAYASYEKASKVTEDAYRLHGQTGVSERQAMELAIIAQSQHDLPTRTLGMSFATTSTQLQKALQGQAQGKSNSSQLAFSQLGIQPAQLARYSNNIPGLVDLVHGHLTGLHNQTQQAQLARTFFGRGASQLGPLFKEGPISKHMEEIGKQTGNLTPAEMQKLNVEVVKLNEQVTLFELKFIKAFGQEIRAAIGLASKAMGPVGSAFTSVFKVIEGVLKGPVGQALAGFGKQAFGAGKQLVEAFKPALPFLKNVLLPLLKGVGEGLATGFIATIKVATRVVQFFAPVLGSIGTAAKPLKPVIEDVGKVLGFVFGPALLGKIASSLKAVGGVLPVVGKGVELLAVPFQAVGKAMGVLRLPAAPDTGLRWAEGHGSHAGNGPARDVGRQQGQGGFHRHEGDDRGASGVDGGPEHPQRRVEDPDLGVNGCHRRPACRDGRWHRRVDRVGGCAGGGQHGHGRVQLQDHCFDRRNGGPDGRLCRPSGSDVRHRRGDKGVGDRPARPRRSAER